MKVLMLNGSAHTHGNTYIALEEIGKTLKEEGIDYEIFQMGGKPVRDCIGCGQCTEKGCVFDDDAVNEFVAKAKEADGFVLVHLSIMHIQAEEYSLSLTESSTAAGVTSPVSRVLLWQWQDVADAVHHLM